MFIYLVSVLPVNYVTGHAILRLNITVVRLTMLMHEMRYN